MAATGYRKQHVIDLLNGRPIDEGDLILYLNSQKNMKQRLYELFTALDTDMDGLIKREDIESPEIFKKQIDECFSIMSTKDRVTFEEFSQFILNNSVYFNRYYRTVNGKYAFQVTAL